MNLKKITMLPKPWFENRMPTGDEVSLNQRSTYILPTKAGFLLMLVILIMMVAATNYQNNLAFLLTFLILSIAVVSIIFTFKNLQGMKFKKRKCESVFAGETICLNIEVSSQSDQAHSGITVGFSKQELFYFDLLENKSRTSSPQIVSLPFETKSRGELFFPEIYSTSIFPFGLLKVWAWFKFQSPVLIYPEQIAPPESVFKNFGEGSEDENDSKTKDDLDFDGIIEYQPSDPISRIDWKASAKERGLYIKSFSSSSVSEQAFDWNMFSNIGDELKLSYLCFLVCNAEKSGNAYSLNLPSHYLSINSGIEHLHQCLTLLAIYPQDKRLP